MCTAVENEQILQLLADSSEASPAVNLDGMRQLLSGQDHSEYAEVGGECGCGHQNPPDLDATSEVSAQ